MKDLYKKLLVVAALFVVALELGSLGGFGIFNNTPPYVPPTTNQTIPSVAAGTAYANATVVGFKPYVIAATIGNVTEAQIRSIPNVEEVVRSQGAYFIGVQDQNNLGNVHAALAEHGIEGQLVANLQLGGTGSLVALNGSTSQASFPTVTLDLTVGRYIPVGTQIGLRIDGAQVRDGQFITGTGASLDFRPTEVSLSGVVQAQDTINLYEYEWEERNLVNATVVRQTYGNESLVTRNDAFTVNATPLEVSLHAQNKSYVLRVQGTKVFVERTFLDKNQVLQDFGPNVVFEKSYILIQNGTIDGRVANTSYMALVKLDENEYGLKEIFAQSDQMLEEEAQVNVNATVLTTGPLASAVSAAQIVQ